MGREAAAIHVRLQGLQRILVQVVGALGLSLVPAALVLVPLDVRSGVSASEGQLKHCLLVGGRGKGDGVLLTQCKPLKEVPFPVLLP